MEETAPKLVTIKTGWAALGKDWAVFGTSKEDVIERFQAAERKHTEIESRPEKPIV